MPLKAWLKSKSTRRQKKSTSFRTEASPPPLSRGNAPRLHTPNYTSPSGTRPQSRSVSPCTTPYRVSEPTPPMSSKRTSPIPSQTVSLLTPPESIRSEGQSWITGSESSPKANRGSDIRLNRESASIDSAVLGESTPKRARSPDGGKGRDAGAELTPPQTPTPSSICGTSDVGDDDNKGDRDPGDSSGNRDVYAHAPTLPGSDDLDPLASRKKELVELFTQHGPVYGEEWRLRGTYDKIKRPEARIPAEDIEFVNEELMNEYARGDEGGSDMWAILLEGGD